MDLNTCFKFNKVGQGCFYTGHLNVTEKEQSKVKFFFAYDCGSDSNSVYIRNEIDIFTFDINSTKNILDLLIISHFDSDHVNQLDYLLNKVKCEKVIIPYVSLIERLLLALEAESDTAYLAFLIDPIKFLLDRGVDQIIILTDEGMETNDDATEDPDGPDIRPDIDQKFDKRLNQANNQTEIINDMTSITDTESLKNVIALNHKGWIFVYYMWKFKFYYRKGSFEKLKSFQNALSELAGIAYNLIEKDTLISLFKDKKFGNIKEAYKEVYTNINSTSLNVYHSPTKRIQRNSELFISQFCIPLYFKRPSSKKFGTLLTGDIDLDGKKKYKWFEDYFIDEFDFVYVLQVPHHGSKNNWYIDRSAGLNKIDKADFYVINFGLGNPFDHPNTEVIDDLMITLQKDVFLNNQLLAFEYTINSSF